MSSVGVCALDRLHRDYDGCVVSGKCKYRVGPVIGNRTYASWQSMLGRCRNYRSRNFENYGERGIKVCERWLDFDKFLDDMGERPDGMTLDRLDSNGHYCPTNCRWASPAQQAQNTNRTVMCPLSAVLARQFSLRGARRADVAHALGVSVNAAWAVTSGRAWTNALDELQALV